MPAVFYGGWQWDTFGCAGSLGPVFHPVVIRHPITMEGDVADSITYQGVHMTTPNPQGEIRPSKALRTIACNVLQEASLSLASGPGNELAGQLERAATAGYALAQSEARQGYETAHIGILGTTNAIEALIDTAHVLMEVNGQDVGGNFIEELLRCIKARLELMADALEDRIRELPRDYMDGYNHE